MDRKEEGKTDMQPEHLVESHQGKACAHEDHGDSLKEAVAHDKCEPDDRSTAKFVDPPHKE